MHTMSVYWLCPETTELQIRRAAILDEIGYQVFFFHHLETLSREVCSKRAQILIVSDAWDAGTCVQSIEHIANLPELNGARLILACSRNSTPVMQAAMNQGFRDIIPDHLTDVEWLQRFEFSTSGMASILELQKPLHRAKDGALTILAPSRLVWVGTQLLWLETRSCVEIGQSIPLRGPFVQALGLEELEVVVQQRQQTHLSYRFSEALIGNWYRSAVERAQPQKILDTLDLLSSVDLGPRPRIFLAIQSPALRTTVGKYLDRRRYEVHSALQQNSLLYEPKYFSPDLVFIEDRLMNGEHRRGFHELLRFLPEHTVVVSIGSKEDSHHIKNIGAARQLRFLKNIPNNLSELIERDYLANLSSRKISLFDLRKVHSIPNDNDISCAMVRLEGKLVHYDERQVEFESPFNLGNYSLVAAISHHLGSQGHLSFLKIVEKKELLQGEVKTYSFIAHRCHLDSTDETS